MTAFDLVFWICLVTADGQHTTDKCARVHLSVDEGGKCEIVAPMVISDWVRNHEEQTRGRAVGHWTCLPYGTELPEDKEGHA